MCCVTAQCTLYKQLLQRSSITAVLSLIATSFFLVWTYRLFKGALHERADVLSVDAVPCDGHEVTARGHNVTEKRKMTIVHVGAVE